MRYHILAQWVISAALTTGGYQQLAQYYRAEKLYSNTLNEVPPTLHPIHIKNKYLILILIIILQLQIVLYQLQLLPQIIKLIYTENSQCASAEDNNVSQGTQ